ncbi:MAG: hypothetical protein L6N96_02975 [Candidatus Methylarchaceae archaeon HK02M2]|nr:hypothetical protein [Candidatus Methylarchaceae archaeon HK02M2]
MMIDLTKLSTPTLKAIRRVLVDGATATASKHNKYANADGTVNRLKKEIAELKKLNSRWQMIQDADVDDVFDYNEDASYILSFSDNHFKMLIDKIVNQRAKTEKELSLAEQTKSIRVPNLIGMPELNAVDTVREHFIEMKDHRRNGGSNEIE